MSRLVIKNAAGDALQRSFLLCLTYAFVGRTKYYHHLSACPVEDCGHFSYTRSAADNLSLLHACPSDKTSPKRKKTLSLHPQIS